MQKKEKKEKKVFVLKQKQMRNWSTVAHVHMQLKRRDHSMIGPPSQLAKRKERERVFLKVINEWLNNSFLGDITHIEPSPFCTAAWLSHDNTLISLNIHRCHINLTSGRLQLTYIKIVRVMLYEYTLRGWNFYLFRI